MTGVILQPSYLPWRGYFHQIWKADVFVFYDDVQYDKHGWRNRNRIKTANGVQWLTVPVYSRGCVVERTPIKAIEIAWERDWAAKHWATLRQAYGKRAPHFDRYAPLLEPVYAARPRLLADLTIELTIRLAQALGIRKTRFLRSSELGVGGSRVEALLAILKQLGVRHYVTGPSAQDYLDAGSFQAEAITLEYMTYDYPPYEQLYPPYDPHVSVVDLLFMTGPDAPHYIWDR